MLISRNRKIIREHAKNYIINKVLITSDDLITLLEGIITGVKMSKTQWKILVGIADKEKTGMINLELFLNLSNNSSKLIASHPSKLQF